jgi:hypothetical protein
MIPFTERIQCETIKMSRHGSPTLSQIPALREMTLEIGRKMNDDNKHASILT